MHCRSTVQPSGPLCIGEAFKAAAAAAYNKPELTGRLTGSSLSCRGLYACRFTVVIMKCMHWTMYQQRARPKVWCTQQQEQRVQQYWHSQQADPLESACSTHHALTMHPPMMWLLFGV